MKYRKKPVVIEATQWTGYNTEKIEKFIGHTLTKQMNVINLDEVSCLIIPTLEGQHIANLGDWIIKGVKGEFYPCKPDIFKETYEEVEE